jgi:hypothetical protein
MITDTVTYQDIAAGGRLDTEFYLSTGIQARRRLTNVAARGIEIASLGADEGEGLADLSQPGRFKRVYAEAREEAIPYLRSYDVFDYLPIPADQLSVRNNTAIAGLRLSRGMIVLPASGRNLGPAVAVDEYLAGFVLSHDAIRIAPRDPDDLAYLLAFINSSAGQALIRGNITGSVIDHITLTDIARIPIPVFPGRVSYAVRALMAASIRVRERSRIALDNLKRELHAAFPPLPTAQRPIGWTTSARTLCDRFDAASYSPLCQDAARIMREYGGVELRSVADVAKPTSRYTAYHVDSTFGRPFLTGNQISQATLIAPKYMADRVFKDPGKYRLTTGEVVFPADGRVNEGLGVPTIVTPDRHGWLASEHIIRLSPLPGVHAGWLYLALTLPHVQQQIQALARGSVVDTLYADDVAKILVPAVDSLIGRAAGVAWADFAIAHSLEQRAMSLFEALIADGSDAVHDVFITAREAAAVKSVSEGNIVDLIAQGALTSLGGADEDSALLSLDEVLNVEVTETHEAASGSPVLSRTVSAFGYVTAVAERSFDAVVSDDPDGSGQVLSLPKTTLEDDDARMNLRAGDKIVWSLLPAGETETRAPLQRSVIRILPKPVLTREQVSESYIWADKFSREHFRLREGSGYESD